MIWRWPSQNTFGMWTVLYWTRSLGTQFGMSINIWRLAGDTLYITCNFLYCNHQVHRDFLITLYFSPRCQFCYYRCFFFFLFFFVIAGASNVSPYTFSSLGKRIRHSFREKRRSLRLSVDGAHGCSASATNCDGCKQVQSECPHILRLQAGWSGVWFVMAAGDLSLLQGIHADSGTHPNLLFTGYQEPCPWG